MMLRVTSSNISRRLKPDCRNTLRKFFIRNNSGPSTDGPVKPSAGGGGGGGMAFKLIGGSTILIGSSVALAYLNSSFRKGVEDNVPYGKEGLSLLFVSFGLEEKSKPYNRTVSEVEMKPYVKLPGKAEKNESSEPSKPLPMKKEEDTTIYNKQAEERRLKEEELLRKKKKEMTFEVERKMRALNEQLAAETESAREAVLDAVSVTRVAVDKIAEHTRRIRLAMENSSSIEQMESEWKCATDALEDRQMLLEKAARLSGVAKARLEQLNDTIRGCQCDKETAKIPAVAKATGVLANITYDLKTAESQQEKALRDANLTKGYHDLVRKGREQFQKELQAVLPDVARTKGLDGKLTEDELNTLIAHAHRRIDQLQRQLAEQQTLERIRIDTLLDRQRSIDLESTDKAIQRELEKMMKENEAKMMERDAQASLSFEAELRKQLARQTAAHSDHLAEVLRIQEQELSSRFNELLKMRMLEEKNKLRSEITGSLYRMQALETAIDARADLERRVKKAQELWLACLSLSNLLLDGLTEKGLINELEAIRGAADGHPFVLTVVEAIPPEALKSGVPTQDELMTRFSKIRHICRRVALVGDGECSLIRYLLSYLQSLFVLRATKPISDDTLFDPNKLSTFVIIDQASYCLERDDLEQALRYMNQLRGQARRVASDWIAAARLLLETRQTANALLAHAAASATGALF